MAKAKACNKELLKETTLATKETASQVREVTSFMSEYIAGIIKDGAFETVLVPYFGKFQAKTKEIQWSAERKGRNKPTGCPIPKDEDDEMHTL